MVELPLPVERLRLKHTATGLVMGWTPVLLDQDGWEIWDDEGKFYCVAGRGWETRLARAFAPELGDDDAGELRPRRRRRSGVVDAPTQSDIPEITV
jgi:hypothetical protein